MILVVIGILSCLFIFAMGYSRFLSQQTAMSDRLKKKRQFSSLARALAAISAHKLQFSPQVMDNPAGRRAFPEQSPFLQSLFSYLAQPLDKFDDCRVFALPLDEDATPHFSMLLEPLWQAAGYGEELEENISVIVNKNDFVNCGPAPESYNREKNGHLVIHVLLQIKDSGREVSAIDFTYSCAVRISSTHLPVLSKFSLYIEDMSLSGDAHKFAYNQVSVDELGNLARSRTRAVPLVLNNDDGLNLPVVLGWRDFIEAQRGLVYLGGPGTCYLNLARSDVVAPSSDSGEGFQFFRRDNFDGTYPVLAADHADGRRLLLSRMNLGVSDDPGERSSSFYQVIESGLPGREQVSQGRCRLSSIFRLCGVERKRSPTLVLGNVMSQFLCISLLHDSSGNPANPPVLRNLSYAAPLLPANYYTYEINSDGYADLRDAFALNDSPQSYVDYVKNYSPGVRQRPYNAGLAFAYKQDDPDAVLLFPETEALTALLKSPSAGSRHQIPGTFARVYGDSVDLVSMKKLLKLSDGKVAYRFANVGGESLSQVIGPEMLLSRGRLALQGWISCANGVKIDRRSEYVSGGGIIVENGDIVIEAGLLPSDHREQSIFHLVALNGDIVVRTAPTDEIQAALIAYSDDPQKGRIVLAQPPKQIRGAMAMRHLLLSEREAENFQGTELRYFAPLAALPAEGSRDSGDEELLSFNFSLFPEELQ